MKYSKLRGKIVEVFGNLQRFAAAMGRSPATISQYLSGMTDWKLRDIIRACDLLGIPETEAHLYFFTQDA